MTQPNITMPIGPRVKTYIALMEQGGAQAPTATILKNTLGNIVWTRQDTGTYIATLEGAFPINNTTLIVGTLDSQGKIYIGDYNQPDQIKIQTRDNAGALSDALLYITPIEIKVYTQI